MRPLLDGRVGIGLDVQAFEAIGRIDLRAPADNRF
jgi:hypothetical protein